LARHIAILNSDDMFLPGKLGKQVAFLDSHPEVGTVLTQVHVIDDDGEPLLGQTKPMPAATDPGRRREVFMNTSKCCGTI
jgi:hypothetical protein